MSEAKAAAGLGNVYLKIGDFVNAEKFHEMDLTISAEFDDAAGKIRAFGNLGSTLEAIDDRNGAIKMFENQLEVSEQMSDHVGQTNALASLGKALILKCHVPRSISRYFNIFEGCDWKIL